MAPRRIAIVGRHGQLARALAEAGEAAGLRIITAARPELDLARAETIAPVLTSIRPDAVVCAAAYTAVDKAESEPDLAYAVNATGAGAVAAAAAAMGVPVVHVSTDYVFPGDKPAPYVEDDPVGPLGVYGASKLAGERAVAAAGPDHVILRTAWVYSPFGTNFVKTMLRVAAVRDVVRVVADQRGCPTSALDLAPAVLRVIENLLASPGERRLRGVFHLAGRGETSWAGFATAVFAASRRRGGPWASVEDIITAEYPTAARRPARSCLDGRRIEAVHGVALGDWQAALETCMDRLLEPGAKT
jgi:dTDP-4-dehydrorhamnose reductase